MAARLAAPTVALFLLAGCAGMPSRDAPAARMESAVVPMAQAALEAGQLETARRLYSRLLDTAPKSVEARMGLGQVALDSGDPARALGWYQAALKAANTPEKRRTVLLAHGRAALAAGDRAAARSSFKRLADESGGDHAAWGHNGVGVVALLEGDAQQAVAAFERAVSRDPAEARFQENLDRAVAIADARRGTDAAGATMQAPGQDADSLAEDAPPTEEDAQLAEVAEAGEADAVATDPVEAEVPDDTEEPIATAAVADPTDAVDDPPLLDVSGAVATPGQKATVEREMREAGIVDGKTDELTAVLRRGVDRDRLATWAFALAADPALDPMQRNKVFDDIMQAGNYGRPFGTAGRPGLTGAEAENIRIQDERTALQERNDEEAELYASLEDPVDSEPSVAEANPVAPEMYAAEADPGASAAPASATDPEASELYTADADPVEDAAALTALDEEQPPETDADLQFNISPFTVVGEDGLYLQLGAFSKEGNAAELSDWAASRTEVPVAVAPPPADDSAQLYRVRVGPVPGGMALPDLIAAFAARSSANAAAH